MSAWSVRQASVRYKRIPLPDHVTLSTPDAVAAAVRDIVADDPREHFIVFLCDTRLRKLDAHVVSIGTLNQALVHPREAFAPAIVAHAACIVIAHNHPSGDPTPSADDHAVTHRMVQAGEILGIRVVDHVVVGADDHFSYANKGMLR